MDLNEAKTDQERTDLALVIEEVLKQRIKGVKNKLGIYVAPAFPKLLYVLDGGVNAKPNDEYYWLTELAAVCSTKRLVPDYISAKKMRELKNGQVYPNMGCRSFLTPDYKDAEGNYKFYGRFNWNVITVNLPDVALSANGDIERFWEILDERLALVKEGHMIRFEYLKNTPSDVAPILWQHGALARKKPGETIEDLFYNSYSTVSVGYAGLYETVKALIGESHTTEAGRELGLSILQRMNDRAAEWKAETGLNFSVYGSPIESVTSKFAEGLKKRFGIIEGLTDKPYITNSYHVHVQEEIDAFSKLSFEAPFQELSPGGAISYIEMPNMQKNIPAVLAVIDHIYENMLYAELNTKADCCMKCGYEGEILTDEELNWYCPNCNNTDKNYLQVVRRTCGYIGSNFWNPGRTAEIVDRVLHLGAE